MAVFCGHPLMYSDNDVHDESTKGEKYVSQEQEPAFPFIIINQLMISPQALATLFFG